MLERFAPLHIPILGFTASGATPNDTGIQTSTSHSSTTDRLIYLNIRSTFWQT
jgi:hypothetical protein